jgi:hypothetical protein
MNQNNNNATKMSSRKYNNFKISTALFNKNFKINWFKDSDYLFY